MDQNQPTQTSPAAMPVNPAAGAQLSSNPTPPAGPSPVGSTTPPPPPATTDMSSINMPSGEKKKSPLILIIIMLVILLVLGAAAYYFLMMRKSETPQPVTTVPQVTTAMPTATTTPSLTVDEELEQITVSTDEADMDQINVDVNQL